MQATIPPSTRGKLRKGLARVRKGLAGRFHQLLSGHAATAEHLGRVGQASSDRCWWCGGGGGRARYHLFVRCQRWRPEIKRLWKRVERDCEWDAPLAPSVRLLFGDVRATPALLKFLEDTRVGRSRAFLAGGPDVDESDLEEIELWASEEEGDQEQWGQRRGGWARPSLLARIFLCLFLCHFFMERL